MVSLSSPPDKDNFVHGAHKHEGVVDAASESKTLPKSANVFILCAVLTVLPLFFIEFQHVWNWPVQMSDITATFATLFVVSIMPTFINATRCNTLKKTTLFFRKNCCSNLYLRFNAILWVKYTKRFIYDAS